MILTFSSDITPLHIISLHVQRFRHYLLSDRQSSLHPRLSGAALIFILTRGYFSVWYLTRMK